MESRWAGEDFIPALSLQLVQAKVQCLDVSDWQQNRIILGTLCKSAVAGFWQRQRGPSLAQEQAVTSAAARGLDLFLCAVRKDCPSSSQQDCARLQGKGQHSSSLTLGVNRSLLLLSSPSAPFSHPLRERRSCTWRLVCHF